jgi:SAM-dependent methyltransferase
MSRIANRRQSQGVFPTSTGLRLNLGCGTTAPDGWINIDRSPGLLVSRIPALRAMLRVTGVLRGPQAETIWPRNIRRHDVGKGLPFGRATAEVIYSSHLIEHLPRDTAVMLLRECARVLQRGGILRVAVPDLRRLAETYVGSTAVDAADEFMRATDLGLETRPRRWGRLVDFLTGARHRWMYDAQSLKAIFQECGFVDISERAYREGRCPDLESVEHRPESIFIEAVAA